MNSQPRYSLSGSALVVVLFIITLLSLALGSTLYVIRTNANTINQAVSWQQAFVAAEAGVHQAAAQVQTQFVPLLNQNNPPDLTGAQNGSGTLTTSGTGEGNVSATFGYVLTGTQCPVGASGRTNKYTYFRILSTGTAQVAGTRYVGLNGGDSVIRKLSFTDTASFATRQVEAWLKPDYSNDSALATSGTIEMNNHNITVDSFDSKDPNRSEGIGTTGTDGKTITSGTPNPIIGYFNLQSINNANGGTMVGNYNYAGIGTSGSVILAGGSYIYGDAMTNGGVTTNAQNVYGIIRDDYSQTLAPVSAPTGTFQYISMPNKGATLRGGTKESPARYQVSSVSLSGNAAQLVFDFGTTTSGTADLNKNYIELYIPGELNTKGGGNGDGAIYIVNGVNVKIYVGGNIALGGNGIANNNGNASSLSILGITPTDGSPRTANFGGTSQFFGTIYAPAYDIFLGGTPTYVGSIVGKSATLVGNVAIRYDEALGGAGLITRYKLVSWFENTKKVP